MKYPIESFLHKYCPNFLLSLIEKIANSQIGTRLAKGIFWSVVGTIVSRGLMLISTIVIARLLGKTVYGEFGIFQSTVSMLGIFAGFGLGITATKHVAEYRNKNPLRAGRILGFSFLFAIFAGSLIAIIIFIFAPWLAKQIMNAPHLSDILRVGSLIVLINALNGTQIGALAGLEAFKTIATVNLFAGLFSFPLMLSGAYFGGLKGLVTASLINLCLNWLLNHIALKKELNRYGIRISYKDCFREKSTLWNFSLPALISGTMVGPVVWTSKIMLTNQQNGFSELGAYTVAESWRTIIFFVCQMVSQANFPILSQLYGEGKRELFKKALLAQFVINGAVVSLSAFLIIMFSKLIMSFYGTDFVSSHLILIIVMLGAIPNQLATVAGVVNKCVGNIWWGVLLNGLWAIVFLGLTTVLVKYGAVGLAWATLIAYCFHLGMTTIYVVWIFRTSSKL